MTEETKPNTETVETEAQVAEVTDEKPAEEFDAERAMKTIHKLREEEKKYKKELRELEQLRQEKARREEAELTEAQRLQKQVEDLAKQKAQLEAEVIRRDVIAETGLPDFLADRLKGSTKEELLADAQELLKKLPQAKVNPKLQPTNPANAEKVETEEQKRERLFGRRSNVFDLNAIKEAGGGVVWNTKP